MSEPARSSACPHGDDRSHGGLGKAWCNAGREGAGVASNPYREPTEHEREQARIIVGRCVTAFGGDIGDGAARKRAEWVVAGFPWVQKVGDDGTR